MAVVEADLMRQGPSVWYMMVLGGRYHGCDRVWSYEAGTMGEVHGLRRRGP